jgi:hypothetical protein
MKRISQIRAAIVDRILAAGIPRVGSRVFDQRAENAFPDELPAIIVYAQQTAFEGETRQPRHYYAETVIRVESIVKGDFWPDEIPPVDPDDDPVQPPKVSPAAQLSEMTEAIVNALIYPWDAEIVAWDQPPAGPFGGLASDVILVSVESQFGDDSSEVVGSEVVSFRIQWNQTIPDIEPPDALQTVAISVKTDPTVHAEDLDQNYPDPDPDP